MPTTLDAIDIKILNLLQKDAKMKIKEIAHALGMTNTPVFDRIKKLEKAGAIKGYTIKVERGMLGYELMAFCSIQLDKHNQQNIQKFENKIAQFEEVVECYHIAGQVDYLLKVVAKDMVAYQAFIATKLAALATIGRVQSAFVMTPVKEHGVLPVLIN